MDVLEEERSDGTEDSDDVTDEETEADLPKNRGYFNRVELVRLALCIGFNSDLFLIHFADVEAYVIDEEGVTTEQVLDLLYTRKFNISIHKTMNIHSQVYNERLIRQVVSLLEGGKIGFSELKQISRAYNFYEDKDGDGMWVDSLTILSVLKMCDRVIGPLQLKNEIARRADIFEIPKRLTMYELIDFYLVSQSLSYWEDLIEVPELPKGKDEGEETYTLSSPQQLEGLQYERILTSLDNEYKKLSYQPVQTKQEKLDVANLINPTKRLQLYEKSRSNLEKEYRKYVKSEKKLWRARAGYRPEESGNVAKVRKKGTVSAIDYSQLDTSRYLELGGRLASTDNYRFTAKEEIIDLKWEMIRSETKYEEKLKELRREKLKEDEESDSDDPFVNAMNSLNRTLKAIQDEVTSPKKKEHTSTLSAERKVQIAKRFEGLDSRFVDQILKNWIVTHN